jgi:hypothetical protein
VYAVTPRGRLCRVPGHARRVVLPSQLGRACFGLPAAVCLSASRWPLLLLARPSVAATYPTRCPFRTPWRSRCCCRRVRALRLCAAALLSCRPLRPVEHTAEGINHISPGARTSRAEQLPFSSTTLTTEPAPSIQRGGGSIVRFDPSRTPPAGRLAVQPLLAFTGV